MAAYDIIQHLSGTPADWAAYNIVIPNGEWAFEEMEDGSRQGKIGNGTDTWSQLPYTFLSTTDPSVYNNWTCLWQLTCDGTFSSYTFTEDNLGNPINYSELYLEINCPAAGQTATTTIAFDELFTTYLIETALPSTGQLVHAFQANSQIERTFRGKGMPSSIAATQFSRIMNVSGAPMGNFNFIYIFNDKNMNYPNGTIIQIWGR